MLTPVTHGPPEILMPAAESPAVAALTRELGAPPPNSVATLPDEVLRRLTAQIAAGRRAHDRAGMAAIDAVLKGVPLPFRAIIKKALR